jgi:outer membrane biosynthesis protein TonB
MEMLEGESLRKILDRGVLPIARAIEIIRDVASGLAHAHLQGVVHGGLKPSSIIVLRSGVVKITDFGIGQAMPPSGAPAGYLGYLSPEQVRGEPIDHRSDIFSLGALFYEMLAHRPPFEGASAKGIPNAAPPPPSEVNPHVPRVLDAIVLSMLAGQPAARMPGVPILLRELQHLEEGLGMSAGAKPGVEEPAASVPPPEPDRRSVMPGVKRMRDREPPRSEAPRLDPTTDHEAFDYQNAIATMDRESRRERSSGSRRGLFTVLAFVFAVLGVGVAGFVYQSSRSDKPSFVASRMHEAPAMAPEPARPVPPTTVADATPKPPTVVPARDAAAPAPVIEPKVQPVPVAEAMENPAPMAETIEKPARVAEAIEEPENPPEAPPPSASPAPEPLVSPKQTATAPAPLPRTERTVARAAERPASAAPAPAQKLPRSTQPPAQAAEQRPGGMARVILAVSPRGEVYIDGKHHGTTPPITTFDLEPGMHRIEVRSGSRTPYLTYMMVQAGDVRRIQYDFDTSRAVHPPRTASWQNIERAAR